MLFRRAPAGRRAQRLFGSGVALRSREGRGVGYTFGVYANRVMGCDVLETLSNDTDVRKAARTGKS